MKKFAKLSLIIISVLLNFTTYASIPNYNDPTTFLGPTARLAYTSSINDTMAYSLGGELGGKNFRIGATWGWKIADYQRFKLSADYLWQNINYSFFSGNTYQWVSQFSIGGAYQYDLFDYAWYPQFDISGFYSHAPSENLDTRSGAFLNAFGVPTVFVDYRRIAGSNAWGLAPGASIHAWDGGRIGIELNYDNVNYDQKNSSANNDSRGFGGTIHLKQMIDDNVRLDLSAALRRPFNNYAAAVNWLHVPFYGDWNLGIFGEYTVGKFALPNTWNVGISANYMIDKRAPIMMPHSLKGEMMAPACDNLLAWTADPAVYLPQVLAVPDGKTFTFSGCPDGVAPSLLATIGDQFTPSSIGTVNLAPFFAGNNLVFSLASISPALDPADTVTVSPSGILSFDTSSDSNTYAITVRATNACGTVVSNSFLIGPAVG